MTHSPKLKAPANSCDVHMHILYPESQFPYQPGNEGRFPPFSVDDYTKTASDLGIERCVVVVIPLYGDDNRCVYQALDDLPLESRGVIALKPDAANSEFEKAKSQGCVGISTFMLRGAGVIDWPQLPELAKRAADFDMHIDLQLDGNELPEHIDVLKNLPCDLVIDHIGKFLNPPTPVDDPAVQCLFELIDKGRTYVKLSAAGETSTDAPPYMKDSGAIAHALASRFPDRCFWASNWPHLGDADPADKPDNAEVLDCLLTWAPDEITRNKILVENPGRFYFGD